ncbi:PQQ-binding-like beta-propeller repeat protein, partial [bacterium]|nr:PQQ-binding-like beta-propeller repeat protein [bacterium]
MKKIKIKTLRLMIMLFLFVLTVQDVWSSDWPMYRADAARSGYTIDPLSARLNLSWVRKTDDAPLPAWSGKDTRMPFDLAFQPVVSKDMVFFGNSFDCKLYAINAKTGFEKWTFFTDSPIR